MAELKCPHCGQAFTVDDAELSSIIGQIRNHEFEKDVNSRITEVTDRLNEIHRMELESQENRIALKNKEAHEKEMEILNRKLRDAENLNRELKSRIDSSEDKKQLAVMEAVKVVEEEKKAL